MIKRILDIILSMIGLIISLPVIALIAILVRHYLGSPVLFRQIRPGIKGQPFVMFKFRTMTDAVDEQGKILSDCKRLTKFGKMLRSTSLDEIPELWNVLKGDMSLVGPRPLLMEYVELYNTHQYRRHNVRPGITGWAQINGRNKISWDEKFALDVWYVDNQSLLLDIKIIFLTIIKVFKRDGISAEGQDTAEKFTGSK